MNSLQNILSSEGQTFLDNLLNKEVVVNEKLNAATLSFKKPVKSEMDLNRNLVFYKGSGMNRKEITITDRVMTNFYALGMTYLNNLSRIIIDKIPGNWTFVCKYFPNHQPSFINYSVLPKNNLVLSCIITNGGIKIEDTDDLRPWAEMFNIAYQEPVFRGFLTQYQKECLMDYIKNGSDKDSFSRFVITLLNPNLTHSLYQNDGFDTPIDGFIFKFISDDGVTKPISAKLIDPYMVSVILKNKSSKGYKDNTDVLLSDFAIFLSGQDLDSILLHGDDENERYLELFYRLFNRYIRYKKSQLEDFDVDTNEIVRESIDTDFDVDMNHITNETTKKILKDNPEYKSIFKTLLGSFKSKKPEDYKSLVMSPWVVRVFNDSIDRIGSKIGEKDDDDSYSFSSYLKHIHKEQNDPKPVADDNFRKEMNVQNAGVHKDTRPLSFADFKKHDDMVEDVKKNKEELKTIEDMIKDLKSDMKDVKSDVRKENDELARFRKENGKKHESEDESKPDNGNHKSDEKQNGVKKEHSENDLKHDDGYVNHGEHDVKRDVEDVDTHDSDSGTEESDVNDKSEDKKHMSLDDIIDRDDKEDKSGKVDKDRKRSVNPLKDL